MTAHHTIRKTGREKGLSNDPCPCGSGQEVQTVLRKKIVTSKCLNILLTGCILHQTLCCNIYTVNVDLKQILEKKKEGDQGVLLDERKVRLSIRRAAERFEGFTLT